MYPTQDRGCIVGYKQKMPPKQSYQKNEIVLAVDKGRLYEAKILKTHMNANKWHYFVHYQGWQPSMDCWLPESKLRKYQPQQDGKKRKVSKLGIPIKDLEKLQPSASTEGESIETEELQLSAVKKSTIAEENAEKKRKAKTMMESELLDEDEDDDYGAKNTIASKLIIPTALKTHLVDEWALIVQEPRKLLKIPKIPNVVAIIEDFLAVKAKKVDLDAYVRYKELFTGLRIYFDKALSKLLLYRQEREQWEIAKELHPHPSQIYGAEHLVRLFVRMPKLLEVVSLTQSEMNQAMSKFMELLNYIQKNSDALISKEDYVSCKSAMDHITKCIQVVKDLKDKEKEEEKRIQKEEKAKQKEEEKRIKKEEKAKQKEEEKKLRMEQQSTQKEEENDINGGGINVSDDNVTVNNDENAN